MAGDQGTISMQMDGMRIEVKGLTQALRAMNKAGTSSESMRDLMHSTGEIVASAARQRAPVASGALRDSIRAGRGKTKAVVRAGTARRVPYAAWAHYGVPQRNIRPTMFMVQALDQTRTKATNHIEQGIKDLLTKSGLR